MRTSVQYLTQKKRSHTIIVRSSKVQKRKISLENGENVPKKLITGAMYSEKDVSFHFYFVE